MFVGKMRFPLLPGLPYDRCPSGYTDTAGLGSPHPTGTTCAVMVLL
jgi:hypothetical protein